MNAHEGANEASSMFFCISEDGVFFVFDAGATAGSGSCEAAHPSLSLHIRTICTATFKCVTPRMQSGCHAASSCSTCVKSVNLLPLVPANANARVAHLCGIWAATLWSSPWWSWRRRQEASLRLLMSPCPSWAFFPQCSSTWIPFCLFLFGRFGVKLRILRVRFSEDGTILSMDANLMFILSGCLSRHAIEKDCWHEMRWLTLKRRAADVNTDRAEARDVCIGSPLYTSTWRWGITLLLHTGGMVAPNTPTSFTFKSPVYMQTQTRAVELWDNCNIL